MAATHGPAPAIGSFSTDESPRRSTSHLEISRCAARRSPDGRLARRTPEAYRHVDKPIGMWTTRLDTSGLLWRRKAVPLRGTENVSKITALYDTL